MGRGGVGERSQKILDTGESAVCWTGEPGQADRSLASTVGAPRLRCCPAAPVQVPGHNGI